EPRIGKGSCTAVARVTTRSGAAVGGVSGTPAVLRRGTIWREPSHPVMSNAQTAMAAVRMPLCGAARMPRGDDDGRRAARPPSPLARRRVYCLDRLAEFGR